MAASHAWKSVRVAATDASDVVYHLRWALLGAVLCSFESWAFGPFSWMYGYGAGLESIPVQLALSEPQRNFALWETFDLGGLDRLAFLGNADPVQFEMLLFSTLPPWLANGLHRFLQYFAAIFFAARVAEEQIGLDRRWSTLAGWLFACLSYFTFGQLLTLPGVPLVLWLLQRTVEARRRWWMPVLAGVLVSLCTTFTFGVPYLLVFAVLWLAIVRGVRGWRAIAQFTVFAAVLMAVKSPQLLAAAANAPFSHRAGWQLEPFQWSFDRLFYWQPQFDLFDQDKSIRPVTMLLPPLGLAVGLAMVLLWRLSRPREAAPFVAPFLRVTGIYALLSQKWLWLGAQVLIAAVFPWVRGFSMGRFWEIPEAFLVSLGLTLCGRLAWSVVLTTPPRRAMAATAAVGFVAFMIIEPKIFLFYPLGVDDWGERNYQAAGVEALKREDTSLYRVASVLPLQPAYAYAQGLEAADGWANLYPLVYRELWLRVLAPLFKELPQTRKVFGVDTGRAEDNFLFLGAGLIQPGVGLLPDEDVWQALRRGFDLDRRFNLDLLRMLNVKYLLSEYPLRGTGVTLVHAPAKWPDWPRPRDRNTGIALPPRQPSLADFGAAAPFAQPFWDLAEAWKRRAAGKDVFIYALDRALPRFRLVDRVEVEPDGTAALDRLSAMSLAELRSTAVLEGADGAGLARRDGFAKGTATPVRIMPDTIDLDVTLDGPGFLVVAMTWNPYWTALVDGEPRPLLRANHAQYGLALPAGARHVRLAYVPPYSVTYLRGRLAANR